MITDAENGIGQRASGSLLHAYTYLQQAHSQLCLPREETTKKIYATGSHRIFWSWESYK